MSNWRDCLRFTEISKAEALFLMTDGVTNFALSDDACRLKNGFIEPINRYLKSEQNKNAGAAGIEQYAGYQTSAATEF